MIGFNKSLDLNNNKEAAGLRSQEGLRGNEIAQLPRQSACLDTHMQSLQQSSSFSGISRSGFSLSWINSVIGSQLWALPNWSEEEK